MTTQLIVPNTISTFIQSQFPRLYDDDGVALQNLLKAYYEWMELSSNTSYSSTTTGNPTNLARNLFNIRDIDTTSNTYFKDFQSAYLVGVPNTVTGDKRFLIKHIIDIYRSKGNIQGYRLLFKLFYNDNVDIYLPKEDILKPSDGTYEIPRYIEVSDSTLSISLVNKTIVGSSSDAKANVDCFVKIADGGKINNVLYLKDIVGNFITGEYVYEEGVTDFNVISASPQITGSASDLSIIYNNNFFTVGDYIQAVTGTGRNATFRVSNTSLSTITASTNLGILTFNIVSYGTYYSNTATIIISRNVTDKDTDVEENKLLLQAGGNYVFRDGSYYENLVSNTSSNVVIASANGLTNSPFAYYLYSNTSSISASNTNVDYKTSGDFTIETSFYSTQLAAYNTILTNQSGTDLIRFKNFGTEVEFIYNNNILSFSLSNPITTGVWYNIALVRSSNTISLYLNGILQDSDILSSQFLSNSGVLLIGSNGTSTAFNGYIQNFRYSSVARYTTNYSTQTTLYQNNTPYLTGSGVDIYVSGISNYTLLTLNTDFISGLGVLLIGSNGTSTAFNGYIQNFRYSSVARYTTNYSTQTTLYQNNTPYLTGSGVDIYVSGISNYTLLTLNTDFISGLGNPVVGGSFIGFSNAAITANLGSTLANVFSFFSNNFGTPSYTISSIGSNFVAAPDITVRDLFIPLGLSPSLLNPTAGWQNNSNGEIFFVNTSNVVSFWLSGSRNLLLEGNVFFTNNSIRVTGTNTNFTSYTSGYLYLVANSKTALTNTDIRIIKKVSNNTVMYLDDYPDFNSDTNSNNSIILPAYELISNNFAPDELLNSQGVQGGSDAVIAASVLGQSNSGLSSIASLEVIDSGFGYQDREIANFSKVNYLLGVNIEAGGSGYETGQFLNIIGGNPARPAQATITANSSGSIVSVSITDTGTYYKTLPSINIYNSNGAGAVLSPVLSGTSFLNNITGYVLKSGVGKHEGRHTSTRSFLSSDKYIQDSYYYQTYSYELKSGLPFSDYKDTVKQIFHPAGVNIFGKIIISDSANNATNVSYSNVTVG